MKGRSNQPEYVSVNRKCTEKSSEANMRKRRNWMTFSLRSLMVVITLLCVEGARIANQINQARSRISALWGNRETYQRILYTNNDKREYPLELDLLKKWGLVELQFDSLVSSIHIPPEFTDEECERYISLFPEIRVVDFSKANKISIKSFSSVSNLQIHEINLPPQATDQWLSFIPTGVTSVQANACGKGVTANGFKTSMQKMKAVYALSLPTHADDAWLSGTPLVNVLDLKECNMTAEQFRGIGKCLPKLKMLDLGSAATDEHLQFIPETVEWLDLETCRKLTDKGVSSAVFRIPNLRHISLPADTREWDLQGFVGALPSTVKTVSINLGTGHMMRPSSEWPQFIGGEKN